MTSFLVLLLFSPVFAKSNKNPLTKDFPYALLTDDFGVLTKDDLKINSCLAEPSPISRDNGAYSYWQCFEIKKSNMICEGKKYDPDHGTRVSLLVLSGIRDGEMHDFISRRTISRNSCLLYQKEWRKLTKNEKYVCISGSNPSKEIQKKRATWNWLFGRYKTKKGCDSYFHGECSLRYQINHNQCME